MNATLPILLSLSKAATSSVGMMVSVGGMASIVAVAATTTSLVLVGRISFWACCVAVGKAATLGWPISPAAFSARYPPVTIPAKTKTPTIINKAEDFFRTCGVLPEPGWLNGVCTGGGTDARLTITVFCEASLSGRASGFVRAVTKLATLVKRPSSLKNEQGCWY